MSTDAKAIATIAAAADGPATDFDNMDALNKRRFVIQRRKLEDPLYYSDYLGLTSLLNSQHPKSSEAFVSADGKPRAAHDELLFIITHQAYELWFKQILHEIDSIREIFTANPIDDTLMGTALHRLQRVREIQTVLIQQITVLETMSPLDFLDFRDFLYPASGFQSLQFRLIENKLGLLPSARITYGSRGYCTYLNPADSSVVEAAEKQPSLHDLVEAWLERTPFLAIGTFDWWRHYENAVRHMLNEDERVIRASKHLDSQLIEQQVAELNVQRAHFATLFDEEKYEAARKRGDRRFSYKAMQAALLITLYQHEPILHIPYRILSSLVDIDEAFTTWRYRHALMVHRQLGSKVGTGGSSGYHYLRSTAERHKIFVDLINLPTFLIPRAVIPPLPSEIREHLSFSSGSGKVSAHPDGLRPQIPPVISHIHTMPAGHATLTSTTETTAPATEDGGGNAAGAVARCPFTGKTA